MSTSIGGSASGGKLGAIVGRLTREPPPLDWVVRQSWHPWLLVGLVCIGAFIGQLDATVVQLALPTLGRTFAAPLSAISWVALAYLVSFACFLPIFGRLCEIFGRKSLYIAGYMLFIVASALCGLASDLGQLIAFRVLQGIGGSLLGANSISILLSSVDKEKRGRALGVFAAAQAIGMSSGPALGGLILSVLDWRWVFWISVPFGIVAIALGWLALPRTATEDRDKAFDWRGALLIGPSITFLVVVLNHGPHWGVASPWTLGFLAASVLLGVLMVRQERSTPSPLVDLALFRSVGFCCAAIAVALAYALLYAMFFLMSFALEHGDGESPAAAGLWLATIPIAVGVVAPFSSGLSGWLGTPRLCLVAMGGCLLALLSLTLAPGSQIVSGIAFALFGAGLGMFVAPNNRTAIETAPARLAGEVGSMLNLMRVLGTSLGVATASSTLTWRLDAATGGHQDWLAAPARLLGAAVDESLAMPAMLAAFAGAAGFYAARRLRDGIKAGQ